MAIYRKINTTFWSDPFVCDLTSEKKLFYLYLLTNERTKQCGIYDISKKQISFDLGIKEKEVSDNIIFFQNKGKIMFSESTNEIALKNWNRFNGSTSPKVVKCIESEVKLVKNRALIDYVYSIDTLSQQTQEETQEEYNIPPDGGSHDLPSKDEIVNWDGLLKKFNEITGKKARVVDEKTKKQIKARLKEGYTKADLVKAIKNCFNDEYHKEKDHKYLTLEFISRPDKMAKFSQDIIKPLKKIPTREIGML